MKMLVAMLVSVGLVFAVGCEADLGGDGGDAAVATNGVTTEITINGDGNQVVIDGGTATITEQTAQVPQDSGQDAPPDGEQPVPQE